MLAGLSENPSPEELAERIQKLYQRGYFSRIAVERGEGGELVFIFEERPLVRSVEIRGVESLSEEKKKEAILVKSGSFLNPKDLAETRSKLLDLYKKEGYPEAEVSLRTEEVGKNEVKVIVEVKEKKELYLARIHIYGNKKIPEEELLGILESQPKKGGLGFLTRAGSFSRELLEQDRQRIEAYYLKNGYLKVRVEGPFISHYPLSPAMIVEYRVEEGSQYRVGEITLGGELYFRGDALRGMIPLKKGEVFDRLALEEGIQRISDAYGEFGFAFARVEPELIFHEEELTADVILRITPGELVFIRRIEITSNTKTRDKVIRRELLLDEGELFSPRKLRESRERIYALGFFDAVTIETRAQGEDQLDLIIQVTERPTGTASAGFGYSSIDQFLGTVRVNFGNFLGYGIRLDFQGEWGGRRRSAILSFTDPYFLDTRFSLGVDLTYSSQMFFTTLGLSSSYAQETRGARLTLGYKIETYTRIFFTLRDEFIRFTDLIIAQSPFFSGGETRSFIASIRRDTRNHPFDPQKGGILFGSVEWAGGGLGGDFTFTKYDLVGQIFFPILRYLTLSLRGETAFATTPGERVPFAERFFVGGIFTLRGYDYRGVGPSLYVPASTGDPYAPLVRVFVGGNKMLLFNTELLFPLIPPAGIKGVLFADAGNVWLEEERFLMTPLRIGYGFGIRWFSPIGPLRFEWGFPYKRQPEERARVFEFTIGTYF